MTEVSAPRMKPSPTGALAQLLLELFSKSSRISAFARSHQEIETIARDLPGDTVPVTEMAHALAILLREHGLVDSELFQELARIRPFKRDEIRQVAEACGVNLPPVPPRTSRLPPPAWVGILTAAPLRYSAVKAAIGRFNWKLLGMLGRAGLVLALITIFAMQVTSSPGEHALVMNPPDEDLDPPLTSMARPHITSVQLYAVERPSRPHKSPSEPLPEPHTQQTSLASLKAVAANEIAKTLGIVRDYASRTLNSYRASPPPEPPTQPSKTRRKKTQAASMLFVFEGVEDFAKNSLIKTLNTCWKDTEPPGNVAYLTVSVDRGAISAIEKNIFLSSMVFPPPVTLDMACIRRNSWAYSFIRRHESAVITFIVTSKKKGFVVRKL